MAYTYANETDMLNVVLFGKTARQWKAYKELEKIVQKQPVAFLRGNGFSINFDSDFANIYDRLYEAHKLLIQSGKYDVSIALSKSRTVL